MDKIKHISNPLTVIAIFAGIAQVAATTTLLGLDPEVQKVFVWFAMIFPVLLVVLFFITLNFKHKVLYAPSDFKTDDSFLEVMRGREKVGVEINALEEKFEDLSKKLLDGSNIDAIKEGLKPVVESLKDQISVVKEKNSNAIFGDSKSSLNTNEKDVLKKIRASGDIGMPPWILKEDDKLGDVGIYLATTKLESLGLVERRTDSGELRWYMTPGHPDNIKYKNKLATSG